MITIVFTEKFWACLYTFFFHKSLDIKLDYFFVKSKSSLLLQIDKHLQEDIYIGGPKEAILPIEEFENLIKNFPTTHEISLYRQAKVTSILKNYFDHITDKEESYQTYLNTKIPTGYFGPICATNFGLLVPVVSVRFVPALTVLFITLCKINFSH